MDGQLAPRRPLVDKQIEVVGEIDHDKEEGYPEHTDEEDPQKLTADVAVEKSHRSRRKAVAARRITASPFWPGSSTRDR